MNLGFVRIMWLISIIGFIAAAVIGKGSEIASLHVSVWAATWAIIETLSKEK